MSVVAFVTWLVAGLLGFALLVIWTANGGRQPGGRSRSRLPVAVLFGHAGLATAGLVVWIAYLVSRRGPLAWLSLGVVAAVALLGLVMFFRWLPQPRSRPAGRDAPSDRPTAEADIPVTAVVLHGLFAAATVILVLLVAVGV